ncbi:MAG: hypothetical protein VX777_03755 [Chlamydiota bacterium]|nr:hypothetical protein [Chlamydiota bacterium]
MSVNNRDLFSRRCPLSDGCYIDYEVNGLNGSGEVVSDTPAKFRCKGMKGVCMIMGILVLVGQDSSGGPIVVDTVPDTFSLVSRNIRKQNRLNSREKSASEIFTIPSRFLQNYNLKTSK